MKGRSAGRDVFLIDLLCSRPALDESQYVDELNPPKRGGRAGQYATTCKFQGMVDKDGASMKPDALKWVPDQQDELRYRMRVKGCTEFNVYIY
jgi:hypothetical protein